MANDDDDFSFASEFAAYGDDLVGKAFPKGTYEMKVKKVVPKLTSGQKRAFVLTLEFTKGPLRGKTVSEQMTWSPENEVAARIFAQGLAILTATQDWIKETKPNPQQIADRMTGHLLEVGLTEDSWNGSPRNRVRLNKNLGKAPATVGGLGAADDDLGSVDMGQADPNGEAEDLSAVSLDDHPGGLEEFAEQGEQEKVLQTSPAASDDEGLDWP